MFTMAKRVFLFLLTNILVVVTISIVLNLLGVGHYITAQGLDLSALAVFCFIWGMGGAFISLGISRIMAKMFMGVKVVDPRTQDPEQRWLVQTVHELAKAAQLRVMPQVGYFKSDEVNAFATGPTKNRALVAVSTGLLARMSKDEARGVLGHEVAHIANGDMVTMTLLQGIVNAFVMFFARIAAFAITQNMREESRPLVNMLCVIVFEILLSFLGMMVVARFSRAREFRADAGGARLAGRQNMIGALQSLQALYFPGTGQERGSSLETLKISGRKSGGLMALLSTHPPLEVRIQRLNRAAI